MKSKCPICGAGVECVALRGRAWIEICTDQALYDGCVVALRGRAWIEIQNHSSKIGWQKVALRGRAWIEIKTG